MTLNNLRELRNVSLKNAAKHKLITSMDHLEVDPLNAVAKFISGSQIKASLKLSHDLFVEKVFHVEELMEEELIIVR